MKILSTRLSAITGALVIGAAVALAPSMGAAEVNFSGKTVTMIVPFKEGGGTDKYARLFQPFFKKHMPGNPKIIVRNVPGGGSIKAANKFQKAKPNGLTLFLTGSSTNTGFVFGGKKVKFDILSWRPVLLSPTGTCFYIHPKTGVTGKDPVADVKILRKGKWIIPGKHATSSELRTYLAYEMLGMKNVTYLMGLSSGKRRKAYLRGEIDINLDSAPSCIKKVSKFIKKGKAVIFMMLGFRSPDGSIVRDPAYPNVYTVREAYKALNGGKEPSGHIWKMTKHFVNTAVMAGKTMQLPKGTSDDIVDTYVATVKRILKDKKFKKLSKRTIGSYTQVLGSDATKVLKEAYELKPDTKKWMKSWIKKNLNVNI